MIKGRWLGEIFGPGISESHTEWFVPVSEEIPSGFGNLELQSHAEAYSTTVTDEPTESGLALVLPHPALGGWTDATNRLAAGLRRFGSALGSTRLTKGCRHCPVVQRLE